MNSDQHHHQQKVPESAGRQPHDPLEKVLRRIRRTRDFPSISKYIVEINQKLSEYASHSSASELANIILKDYALTNKLLKLVNSAFYGFVSGKVTTVTRAVVLLGYDNVRLAAVSLMLFEHFQRKSEARDLKDATISSFWCGLIAKEIAKAKSITDPEEAFICAMLHQLGKLLVIYHMPDAYQDIKSHLTQGVEKEAQAVKRVLGISYEALGGAVARQWNFPDSIFRTMVPLSDAVLADKEESIEPLHVLANFAHALSRIIDTLPLKRRSSAIKRLLARYANHICCSAKEIQELMLSCLDSLNKHANALQFSVDESDFLLRLSGEYPHPKSKQDSIAPVCPDDAQDDKAGSFRLADIEETALPDGDDAIGILMAGIQEMSCAMVGDYDINDIALMSLEIIYRAMQFRRALLFIHDGSRKALEARYGYGNGVQDLIDSVTFDIGDGGSPDLFSKALRLSKDLVVDDARQSGLNYLLPPWYTNTLNAKAFLFMPIKFQKICVGAYYADVDVTGPPVSAVEHKYISMLRNQFILGIKMGRL